MRVTGGSGATPSLPPENEVEVREAGSSGAGAGDGNVVASKRGQDLESLAAEAVETGRKTRKSGGPEGVERVIGADQAKRIEKLLATASPEVRAALAADLARIRGPDAALGRALYLKAAVSRAGALLGPRGPAKSDTARSTALATLSAFARRVSNQDGQTLLARSTVVDLDSRVSTSEFDAVAWDERRGVVHARGQGDRRGDNDGLLQRFTGSCGSTSILIAIAEEDPVQAFALNDEGVQSMETKDLAGRFQAELLAEHKSDAFSRRVEYNLSRLKNGLGRLKESGEIKGADRKALLAFAENEGKLDDRAKRALESLRAYAAGFPTDADLSEIRDTDVREDQGLTGKELGKALGKHLTPITGQRYVRAGGDEGLGQKGLKAHLDDLEKALRRGADVPFGVTEPAHWMIFTAVTGDGDDRRFLVSDPWTGRTGWASDKELTTGRFVETLLDHPWKKKDEIHVDELFLPEPVR